MKHFLSISLIALICLFQSCFLSVTCSPPPSIKVMVPIGGPSAPIDTNLLGKWVAIRPNLKLGSLLIVGKKDNYHYDCYGGIGWITNVDTLEILNITTQRKKTYSFEIITHISNDTIALTTLRPPYSPSDTNEFRKWVQYYYVKPWNAHSDTFIRKKGNSLL
ncbi:MAG: hypothetical protein JST82_04565 [Bacteroidetes bacterium]|nr:hypothetical protein [Bacteroidota bacterium]